jgi:hypothetical protein
MSLATDSIFIAAIQSNPALVERIGGRLYGTAIPLPDEDADNVDVPYIIVTFDGLNNQNQTKDDVYEGSYDTVNIGVEVTGKTIKDLHDLTQMVRDTVLAYFHANHTNVEDYTFSAEAIQYDSLKPCYWQTLRYQCEVYNLEDNDDGQG